MHDKNELDFTCGLSDDEITRRFKEAIRIDEEIRTIMGLPQARYDDKTKLAYLLYPDGRRTYIKDNTIGEVSKATKGLPC